MRNRFVIIVGVFALAAPGCLYHGNPYGYYGPGPSVMPQQPWPSYPAGTYPSYGPNPYGNGGTYTPSNQPTTIQPTPVDPGSPDTYKPGGNAPNFDPSRPSDSGGNVPDPDPTDDRGPTGSNSPSLTPTNTSRRSNNSRVEDDVSTPFEQDSSTRLPRSFANEAVTEADEEEFQSPVMQTSGSDDGNTLQANRETLPAKIYRHSPRFDWLTGYVEYDEDAKVWVIMYDDNPKPSDKLGGEVTLADHPNLRSLQDNDAVRVDGYLDRSLQDTRGLPVFRITKLKKLSNQ